MGAVEEFSQVKESNHTNKNKRIITDIFFVFNPENIQIAIIGVKSGGCGIILTITPNAK